MASAKMVSRVVSSSISNLLIQGVQLRAQVGRSQTQLVALRLADLGVAQALAQAPGGGGQLVENVQHLAHGGLGSR
ncbi:MAG: hypothetical protein HC834_07995 [Rhodospirillales bacterium]|nr:hypothetical protein [Rhodospirillales bacterium]